MKEEDKDGLHSKMSHNFVQYILHYQHYYYSTMLINFIHFLYYQYYYSSMLINFYNVVHACITLLMQPYHYMILLVSSCKYETTFFRNLDHLEFEESNVIDLRLHKYLNNAIKKPKIHRFKFINKESSSHRIILRSAYQKFSKKAVVFVHQCHC